MALIGLVTVLYKCDGVLKDFFLSLSQQSVQGFKLYVVDNSPNAVTDELIESFFDSGQVGFDFCHIRSDFNTGFALGNNIGIERAIKDGCTHLVILNNDIVITDSNFLHHLLVIGREKQDTIIVPKILYFDTRKIWSAGGYIDKWRALGVHVGIGKDDVDKYHESRYVGFSPGCFYFLSVNLLKQIGFFDEKFFVYTEDTDWVYRANVLGIKMWYEASLEILHKVSSSTGGDRSLFYIYYSNRNKIYFIYKHYGWFLRMVSLGYFLMTRVVYFLRFNKEQQRELVRGIRDGFKL